MGNGASVDITPAKEGRKRNSGGTLVKSVQNGHGRRPTASARTNKSDHSKSSEENSVPSGIVKMVSYEFMKNLTHKSTMVKIYVYFFCLMMFKATFNNISAISWRSVLLVGKTTDLSQVTDKFYHIIFYTST